MLAIGQLLDGRYRVVQPLGGGGFGQTYLAQDTKIPNHPTCVVKHLKPASNDPQILETARRLFKNEAEILAVLGNHPQIPRLLAYFEEDREFYLVQEYIPGQTLDREIVTGQAWTEGRVINLLQEVLAILEFIHDRGTIHRDIKPSNLIRRSNRPNLELGESGTLVLIDFGAIKQIQTQAVTNAVPVSVAIGTPGYMPGEQVRGQPRPSSDIYALGMLGIQAITGRSPTELPEDPQTGEVVWQHLTSVNPALGAILSKMTRYHFKDRYQRATEAIFDLQNLQQPATLPAVATVPVVPTTPVADPSPRPNPLLVPLVVLGSLTAAVAASFAIFPHMERFFASKTPSTPSSPTPSAIATCTVRASDLNIRARPTSSSSSIGSLNAGDRISLTGEREGAWLRIIEPQSGWVRKVDLNDNILVTCPGDIPEEPTLNPPRVRRSPGIRSTPSPKPTPSPTPVVQPTTTPLPSPSPTPTPTPEASPTPSPTLTPIPESPSPEVPTVTETPIPIDVPSPETPETPESPETPETSSEPELPSPTIDN